MNSFVIFLCNSGYQTCPTIGWEARMGKTGETLLTYASILHVIQACLTTRRLADNSHHICIQSFELMNITIPMELTVIFYDYSSFML